MAMRKMLATFLYFGSKKLFLGVRSFSQVLWIKVRSFSQKSRIFVRSFSQVFARKTAPVGHPLRTDITIEYIITFGIRATNNVFINFTAKTPICYTDHLCSY